MKRHIIFFIAVACLAGGGFVLYAPASCEGKDCLGPQPAIADPFGPESVLQKTASGEITLVDVRESDEWAAGHIAGAKHVPLGSISAETFAGISKDKPVYLYCRSGRRAGEAETAVRALGYSDVVNIGGIVEWQEKGGTLVP